MEDGDYRSTTRDARFFRVVIPRSQGDEESFFTDQGAKRGQDSLFDSAEKPRSPFDKAQGERKLN